MFRVIPKYLIVHTYPEMGETEAIKGPITLSLSLIGRKFKRILAKYILEVLLFVVMCIASVV
jgi:hypothetical protein